MRSMRENCGRLYAFAVALYWVQNLLYNMHIHIKIDGTHLRGYSSEILVEMDAPSSSHGFLVDISKKQLGR